MLHFRKKAIIRTREEWDDVYRHTKGGDDFPCSPVRDLPCLVLEATNPSELQRDFTGTARWKSYVFITAADIRELLKT